ncbi:MAG: flagellar brake protein [Deltaproteobacteria bacterium]|nr:flagellar brake protein [Deltaproteobacteria bacterium]
MDFNTVLQLQVQGYPNRLKSYLVGREEGRYLIIKIPMVVGRKPEEVFAKDKELVVRYVHRGSVFGFRSPIMLPVLEPFNVAFVKFPKKIEDYNLRTHKRFDCSLPARLEVVTRHQDRTMRFKGVVGDISKGGCKATIGLEGLGLGKKSLKIQSAIAIFLFLPGVEGEFFLPGVVKSMSQDSEVLSLGIQFVDLSGNNQSQLDKFLAANQV